MTDLIYYLFWIGLTVIVYTYLGYGIVIYLLSKLAGTSVKPHIANSEDLPEVTFLIAAYNEEHYIEDKIKNTLSLDYPADKLSVLVVTDGSSDRTPELVKKFHAVKLFHEAPRKGKIHAVNRVMKFVKTPIVIFSDANTFVNGEALRNIVRHYQDGSVGGVAGEKRIFKKEEDNASGAGEGVYWKYESFLKRKDAEVYSIVGAAGELFSIRTKLYEEPEENIIIEDFYMSLKITAKGYRFMYEPEAYAIETASATVDEEWKRKVRICAGGFQAMSKLKYLLNPFRYGILSFQYISHRVLRWTLAPIFLPIILACNFLIALDGSVFYNAVLAGQIFFYAMAFLGYLNRNRNISIKGFFVPYYFAVMNLSVYAGFVRYRKGQQSVLWEKAQRASMSPQSVKT
jgi:cellulose synthase/poly-beta-1,6-N-acetylglucosamine synthase-like glycosyltransferase